MRGGAVAARRAHNPEVLGSNPSPATRGRLRSSQPETTRAILASVVRLKIRLNIRRIFIFILEALVGKHQNPDGGLCPKSRY